MTDEPEPAAMVEPRGLRPDAPPYAVHGPHAVSTREFTIETAGRTVPVTVWYPALNPDSRAEEITYSMDVGDQGLPQYPALGNALLDAAPDLSGAPYPLVVWSHGAYLYRQTNVYLAEHLASQGFVVVAGNHEDNWGTFPAPNATSIVSRPADVSAWIDFAEAQSAAGGELAGLVDTEHIAVGGHSYRGYTALAVAVALFDPNWYLNVACADNVLAEDDPLNDCSTIERELPALASLAGLDAVPAGLWPSWQDPRVDAIFLLAPSSVFGVEGAAAVTIAVLSLTGSADPMQDAALHVYLTHENLASANKSMVVFQEGGHTMFLNDCNSATGMANVAYEWCSDAVWDTDRVHDLTNHLATAFLLAELKGDAEAAAALAPENVAFPGIRYETTAYGAVADEPAATPEVFIQGAPVRLSVGLAVGPDDNLYVSNQWVRSLQVLNPDTGEIIKSLGPDDGVDIPADLAFGPDGSLCASMYPGFEGDAIMRIAPDGAVTSMALPPVIWPVLATKDGRLFAALLFENDVIVELDPDFQSPPRELVRDGAFIHLREGPDGMIYALKWFDGEIVRFDPDAPDQVETVATGLTLPFNLAFDSNGQLMIIMGVDESTDAVARLDLATGEPEILVTTDHLLYGLAIDSKNRIFVSSADDGTIFELLPEGDVRIVSPGGMILPGDVEVIARPDGESLFLADWVGWREYDAATGELRSSRHGTWWPGTLTNPDTIAPFGDYLLLASSEIQQIQIWDPVQQKEVLLIDLPGADNAIAFDDTIVAASYESKDVVQIDPADPDQRNVLATGLEYPLGLASEAGNLYVGDFLAGQILQVMADGVPLDPLNARASQTWQKSSPP